MLKSLYFCKSEKREMSGLNCCIPEGSSISLNVIILRDLQNAVLRVKRARRWYLVDKLTKAFIESLFMMRLKYVKSMLLMKAIIKTLRELKEIISEEERLMKAGISEAWKISKLASSWGNTSAEAWKYCKSFIIYQGLVLRWLSRLFGGILS